MSIYEFIQQNGYTIDNLYVDRFWYSVSKKQWIYVSDELLKWIGYESIDLYKLKERYTNLIVGSFTKDVDYRHLSSLEIQSNSMVDELTIIGDINMHNKVKHLILSPRCFKESLMLIQTNKAKRIRKYYLDLEEIFTDFLHHELKMSKMENSKQTLLFKSLVADRSMLKPNQYIYIATSRNYANQCIFKVGMTTSLGHRLSTYQTGRCIDDRFHYVYIMQCVDAKSAEQYIFARLSAFNYDNNKELFCIHIDVLVSILQEFERSENTLANNINKQLVEYYDNINSLEPKKFDDVIITDVVAYANDKFNKGVPNGEQQDANQEVLTIDRDLTTEKINTKLALYGVQLVDEYSGHCEEKQKFKCVSIFGHQFECTYSHMNDTKEQGCVLCRPFNILNGVPIYVYEDSTYKYITKYNTFDELKTNEPEINHQLLKNIIREQRWLTPCNKRVYSILSPEDGKLDLNKNLTSIELAIIAKLGIDYDTMKAHILRIKMSFIMAIDDVNKKAYYSDSITQMASELTNVLTGKHLNRKTVSKYIGSQKKYGGYLWFKSSVNTYDGYECVKI